MQHGRRVIFQQQARPIHCLQIGKRRVLLYAPSNKRLPDSVVGSTLKHGVLDSLGLVRPTTRALVLPRLDVPFPTTLQLVTAQTESNLLSQARAEIHRAVPSQERRNTPTVGVKPGFHIDKRLPFL